MELQGKEGKEAESERGYNSLYVMEAELEAGWHTWFSSVQSK